MAKQDRLAELEAQIETEETFADVSMRPDSARLQAMYQQRDELLGSNRGKNEPIVISRPPGPDDGDMLG